MADTKLANANQIYDNFVLTNEVKHAFDTAVDLAQFCTVDRHLEGLPGDKRKINVYDATSGAEVVEMGQGNTKDIAVTLVAKEFEVKEVQTRFPWFDEQARRDPMCPIVGSQKVGADLFNFMQKDIYAEFEKATKTIVPTGNYFNDLIDAVAELDLDLTYGENGNESLDPNTKCFCLMGKKELAKARKSLADNLKYVEAYARTGYVGTVADTNIFVSNLVAEGHIIVAHPTAVKLFTKEGVSTETDRDVNHRQTTLYGRQAYIAALYDATKVCVIKTA